MYIVENSNDDLNLISILNSNSKLKNITYLDKILSTYSLDKGPC